MRKITTVLPVVALSLIGLAGTASADVSTQSALDGVCQSGELCLYYNSNEQGSLADFELGVKDFATVRFISGGAGQGQLVKNNAASACNKAQTLTARIFFNSNWQGAHDDIAPGTCRNLVNTYNENASLLWVAPGA